MRNPASRRAIRSRIVLVMLLVLALIGSLAAVLPAGARAAVPPAPCEGPDCPPEPEPTVYSYTSTVSVSPPPSGVITATSSTSPAVIDCRPGGEGTCSVTDTIETTSSRRPVGGWPAYTVRAADGPAGYAYRWHSGCNGDGDCVVTNNKESTPDVAGRWVDVQAPQLIWVDVPSSASNETPLRVMARDNDRVSTYHWRTCAPDHFTCDRERIGTADVYTLGERAGGTWNVYVRAGDPAGNWSGWASVTTTYDIAAPTVTITSPTTWSARRVDATFTVSDAGTVTTACAVDGREPTACTSPYVVDVSEFGAHVLHVVATDAAGNSTQVDRAFRAVAYDLRPGTDNEPTYGREWSVVYGHLPGDATGTVTVRDRATRSTLCSGPAGSSHQASCRVPGTALRPGAHTIDVTYAGDAANPAATGSFALTVLAPAPPTTALAASAPTTRYGTAHPLIASRLPAAATGVVTFTSAGRTLCRAVVRSGTARCLAAATSLRAGTHTATATFTDPVFARQQATTRVVVTKGLTRLTARAGVARVNRRTTLAVSVLPRTATGRVVFTTGRTTLCTATVRNGRATCTTAPHRATKRVTVLAHYTGDANWSDATTRTRYRVTR